MSATSSQKVVLKSTTKGELHSGECGKEEALFHEEPEEEWVLEVAVFCEDVVASLVEVAGAVVEAE
ncbi:hypothetical protein CRUP_008323 [Coryphaenoides rupestris]|nr:hypothetical protein CRUP_008323 [Coryphaenoides rupestris]